MRERLASGAGDLSVSLSGPVTRSREQGIRGAFAVEIMEPEHPGSPAAASLGMEPTHGESHANRVLVSEPLQRNLEAARKHILCSLLNLPIMSPFLTDYLSGDQPARICHRVRTASPSSSHQPATRSPTRRAAASSSCPSPLSAVETESAEGSALLKPNDSKLVF